MDSRGRGRAQQADNFLSTPLPLPLQRQFAGVSPVEWSNPSPAASLSSPGSQHQQQQQSGGGGGFREAGIVEKLLPSYGFIQCCERQARLFFHYSQFTGNIDHLRLGDPVEFEMTYDKRTGKPIASQVVKISSDASLMGDDSTSERVAGFITIEVTPEREGRVAYENRGECFFLPFTQVDVEDEVILKPQDRVTFNISTDKSGNLRAKNLRLETPVPAKFQGVVCTLKDTFGFIERADVVKEIFFHSTECKDFKALNVGDDVEFVIQTRNGKEVACGVNQLPAGTVVFEDIDPQLLTGRIKKTAEKTNAHGGHAYSRQQAINGSANQDPFPGKIVHNKNGVPAEISYGERDIKGEWTVHVGDLIEFNVVTDRRDGLQHATNISLKEETFWISGEHRETGYVAALKESYGFIKCLNHEGTRVYFRLSELMDPNQVLQMNDEVEFTVVADMTLPGRLQAIRIKFLPQGTILKNLLSPSRQANTGSWPAGGPSASTAPAAAGAIGVSGASASVGGSVVMPGVTGSMVLGASTKQQPQQVLSQPIHSAASIMAQLGAGAAPSSSSSVNFGGLGIGGGYNPMINGMNLDFNNSASSSLSAGSKTIPYSHHGNQQLGQQHQYHQQPELDCAPLIDLNTEVTPPAEQPRSASNSAAGSYGGDGNRQDGGGIVARNDSWTELLSQLRLNFEMNNAYANNGSDNASATPSSQGAAGDGSSGDGGMSLLGQDFGILSGQQQQQSHTNSSAQSYYNGDATTNENRDQSGINSSSSSASSSQMNGTENGQGGKSSIEGNADSSQLTPVVKPQNAGMKNGMKNYVTKGVVAALKESYGFIETEDHTKEVFFHFSIYDGDLNRLDVGHEVEYVASYKGSKLSAEYVSRIPSGSIPQEEPYSDVMHGVVMRSIRCMNPDQEEYQGLVQLRATMSDENGPEGGMNENGDEVITRLYEFSVTSLQDKHEFIQKGDVVEFRLAKDKTTGKDRAVAMKPIRTKYQAPVDAIKGNYGFLNYECEGKKKLFFHMSEVKSTGALNPGDIVEFVIVHHQRSNKYSACNVVKIGETPVSERPQRLIQMKKITEDSTGPKIVHIRQPLGPDGTKGFGTRRGPIFQAA